MAHAQGDASIAGVVTDASGSAIPRAASVKVENTETGTVRNVATDSRGGRYLAPTLPVGSYNVTVARRAVFKRKRRLESRW